ncbi:MAG: Holliday junction branch migration protein RuvA [Candidatus Hydrogenedentota bacterium]|nr:MAG: Holliday junction branch migration protein RuvA [Candidatus Hydrogenedentota bacterium]
MISRITGEVIHLREDRVTVEHNGIAYDLLIPSGIIYRLRGMRGREATFYTFHYLEGGMGVSNPIPRLAGFLNEIDREFFEKLITVQGMGIRVALKALSAPVQSIARAIETKDVAMLASLPGIGKRTAEKIIAELNGKLAKFALIRPDEEVSEPLQEPDFKDEVVEVLLQLGYSQAESEVMLRRALSANAHADTAEELIREIFKQQREQ